MTKTIRLTNQYGLGTGPRIYTTDAVATDDAEWSEWDTAIGLLDAKGLAQVRAILEKYSARSKTNSLGVGTADTARAAFDAQLVHTRSIAAAYKEFWDRKNSEFAAAVRR